jgi:AcrR family transcriptional regulator
LSKREQNKSDKRGQIIKAARELMRIRSSTGFSMRQLADASGVSLATPYNLFGSKQGIHFSRSWTLISMILKTAYYL